VVIDNIYRMRSSVALVKVNEHLEMFKTNVRDTLRIKIDYENIIDLLQMFDGIKISKEIFEASSLFELDEFEELIGFLNSQYVLIKVDCSYEATFFKEHHRVINQFEDYSLSTSEVIDKYNDLQSKTVLIIGLGGVGTWVTDTLAMSGVKNFILVDDDIVDETNLHRQDCFFLDDVGKYKVDCVKHTLDSKGDYHVECLKEKLDDSFFYRHDLIFDLVINCADYPSVDYTTELIGAFCMENKIPHVIGGGYNLHLSLIGQSVVPGITACVKCFSTELEKINNAELEGVKKLYRPTRKIGSFGPMCSLSASITSTESIKILTGSIKNLTTSNKRIEFRSKETDFFIKDIHRNSDCEWCGSEGQFNN